MPAFPAFSIRSTSGVRAWNFVSSATLVVLSCAAYAVQPIHKAKLALLYGGEAFSFTGLQFIVASAVLYVALLGAYYAGERVPTASKSLVFFRVLIALLRSPARVLRQGLSREERLAVLSTLLKAFFGPMMTVSLMVFMMG